MRYTNSQKISEDYLEKEKDKIREILYKNDFPFMEKYWERLAQISLVNDRYEALKETISLYNELTAPGFYRPYETYFIEIAEAHLKTCQVTSEAYKLLDFCEDVLEKFPVAKIGCLTKLQSLVQDFYNSLSILPTVLSDFGEKLYPRMKYIEEMVWFWEGAGEHYNSYYESQLFTLMTVMMKLPDEQAFPSALYLLKRSEGFHYFYLHDRWMVPKLKMTASICKNICAFDCLVPPVLRVIIYSKNEIFFLSPYVCNCLMGCIHHLSLSQLKNVRMMFEALGNSADEYQVTRHRNKSVHPHADYLAFEAYRKIVDVFIKLHEADEGNALREYLIINVPSRVNCTSMRLEDFLKWYSN